MQIAGAWSGAVVLGCDEGFAHTCATTLFEVERCSEAEIRDALGELTHIVAGNLKALLPAPSELSPPTFAGGPAVGVPGTLLEHVHFQLAGQHRLDVRVLAADDD